MDERKRLEIDAKLEGENVVMREAGKKTKVSDLELLALCNLAWVGCLHVMSDLCEGETSKRAGLSRDAFMEDIREGLRKSPDDDAGLQRLTQSCVAVLRAGRLEKYLLIPDE
jgi:hypothetical protein